MTGYLHWSSVSPWALLFAATGLVCGGLVIPAWQRRERPGGVYTAALMAAAGLYSLLYAFELQAPNLAQTVVWAKIEYLGVASLPLFWFLFARSYTGVLGRLPPGLRVVLYAVPCVTILLAATNGLHHLIWTGIQLNRTPTDTGAIAQYQHGLWFWVQAAYSWVLVLLGGVVLVRTTLRYPGRYKWRAAVVLLAAVAPWVGNALYAFGVRPAGGVDLTALAFFVTAASVSVSMAPLDFLRLAPAIVPVARETLIERMKDLVLAVDLDDRIVWANEAARAALDESTSRLAGRLLAEVMPKAPDELVFDGAIPGGAEGDEKQFELALMVGGSKRIYDVLSTQLHLKPSGGLGRLLVFRDITERREAEEALRESQEELRQSQKMEAIGRLAGGIAHDFNNLLTAILGYGDMILSGPLEESVRRDMGHVMHAADKARSLTAQILAFSRRQPREVKALSPDQLIENLTPLLTRALGEDIRLVLDLAADDALVEVDPGQLSQVLMNLAVNARDAMPRGGILTIKTSREGRSAAERGTYPIQHTSGVSGTDWWRLTVSDTGVGIAEAIMDRVFEPFFTTKSPGEGTGLGLSTVYGIVKQSGGDISAYSRPGVGASFVILLPIIAEGTEEPTEGPIQAARETSAAPAEARAGEPVTRLDSSDPRDFPVILLVEDEPLVRSLAIRALHAGGYQVIAASNGSEALAFAKDQGTRLDLLLTDVVLPGGIRGDEVARSVCATRPNTEVLFMSGHPRGAILQFERMDSSVNYLQKPFTAETLTRTVQDLLAHQHCHPRE